MKRYHRRQTCSHTSPRRSPTMVTFVILGLSSADGGMTVGLWNQSSLDGRRPPWYRLLAWIFGLWSVAFFFFFFLVGRQGVSRTTVSSPPLIYCFRQWNKTINKHDFQSVNIKSWAVPSRLVPDDLLHVIGAWCVGRDLHAIDTSTLPVNHCSQPTAFGDLNRKAHGTRRKACWTRTDGNTASHAELTSRPTAQCKQCWAHRYWRQEEKRWARHYCFGQSVRTNDVARCTKKLPFSVSQA